MPYTIGEFIKLKGEKAKLVLEPLVSVENGTNMGSLKLGFEIRIGT